MILVTRVNKKIYYIRQFLCVMCDVTKDVAHAGCGLRDQVPVRDTRRVTPSCPSRPWRGSVDRQDDER